jgi:translocation and assembly module TamB
LAFERNGLGVDIRGTISGDLLAPGDAPLLTSLKTEVTGDLQRILSEISPPQKVLNAPVTPDASKDLRRGAIHLQASLSGDLLSLAKTADIQAVIRGRGLQWGPWRTDQLEAEAEWKPSRDSNWGQLDFKRAVVSSEELPRVLTQLPGRGGEVRVGAFRWLIGQSEKLEIPVELERAHLHWLAAAVVREVWPLELRVNGSALLKVRLPNERRKQDPHWGLKSELKLGIDRLVLDNQKPGRSRPRTVVLDVPKIRIEGAVNVDSHGIYPEGFTLKLPNSSLAVTGKVDFESGFDLDAAGPIRLIDIGNLSGSPIRGDGDLRAHIYGPTSRVMIDFDPNLTQASYLSLNLGQLKGRITYDEDPQHLFIQKVNAHQRALDYVVDGTVDLSDAETIDLNAELVRGDINDLIEVFAGLTSGVSWFPKTLTGAMHGSLKVSGGLDLEKLIVTAGIVGTGWSYWGESFQNVSLSGGYDRGRFSIRDLRATKKNGRLRGHISWKEKEGIDWNLRTENFSVGDVDSIARLDVPIRGRVALSSSGKGLLDELVSDTRIQVFEAGVRGSPVPPSELSIRSANGVATVEGLALGGQGELEASYDSHPGRPAYLKLNLRDLDFAPLLLLLNPKLIQDRELRGTLSGGVDLKFLSGQIDRASGKVSISDYKLERTGVRFSLVEPVSISVDRGDFGVDRIALQSALGQQVALSVVAENTRLEGNIEGVLDLSLLEFLTSSIEKAQGGAKLKLGITGQTLAPELNGKVYIGQSEGGAAGVPVSSIKIASVDTPFENMSGVLVFRKGGVTVSSLSGELAGGSVVAKGAVEVFANRWPTLDLGIDLSGSKIKVWPFQYAKVRGKLNVSGTTVPWLVTGDLEVDEAFSKEKLSSGGGSSGGTGTLVRYAPPPGSGSDLNFPKFMLDIGVRASRGVLMRNDLFDVELGANIRVINSIDSPRITGTTSVIRGNMIFRDRVFQIQTAGVDFDNPAILDPKISLAGFTEVSGTRVNLGVTGRLSSYKIDFTSNPVLPESEILSLLALGFTTSDMQRLKSGDR